MQENNSNNDYFENFIKKLDFSEKKQTPFIVCLCSIL